MGYRVKTVSAMTGLPRPTLLAWERRYAILEPNRSATGYREYTDADVATLRRLKALVDAGYSIGEAVALEKGPAGAEDALRALSAPVEPPEPGEPPPARDHDAVVQAILRALLAFDRSGAERQLPWLGQVPFVVAVDEVFVPVLRALGEGWARGEVSIAQEHFVSGFCREHLLAMYHGLGGGPEAGVTIACATPPGERHELGLLVLSLKLALAGHRVVWLGADLPVPDLCAYLVAHPPRFVCLSFTRAVDRESLLAYARQVRAGAPRATGIVLGGPGVAAHVGPLLDGVVVYGSTAEFQAVLGRAGESRRETRAS